MKTLGSLVSHNTEASRFIRSIQGIIGRIPLITAVTDDRIFIKPSGLSNVPQHLKSNFEIVLRYKSGIPYKAACLIYSPKKVVTIVIIINKKYESDFQQFLKVFPNTKYLYDACERRSVYIHEICHLAAAIKLFPDNYDTNTRKKFVAAIEKKFGVELKDAEDKPFFTHFEKTVPPFLFDDDHFSFDNDKLDYHEIYQELMISDDGIKEAVTKMFEPEMQNKLKMFPRHQWIVILTQVAPAFFAVFYNKVEKFSKEIKAYLSAAA